jgi:hypothetical protein
MQVSARIVAKCSDIAESGEWQYLGGKNSGQAGCALALQHIRLNTLGLAGWHPLNQTSQKRGAGDKMLQQHRFMLSVRAFAHRSQAIEGGNA